MCFAVHIILYIGLVVAESSIAGHILHRWVESAAFQGFSKNHIKKVKEQYSFWKRFTLLYLIHVFHNKQVNKRLGLYWTYWLISIGFGFVLGWRNASQQMLLRVLLFMWLGIQIAIYLLWRCQKAKF